MFESIWERPVWEIFAFFSLGTALAATVGARAALRLGVDYPSRRPICFGAEIGAALGVAICAYLWAATNPTFEELDGAALSVCEKARLAGFPTSEILTRLSETCCAALYGAALAVQTALIGAAWGATGLRRCVVWLKERSDNSASEKKND